MGLGLDFRPLLLSIIHFEKDTGEKNRRSRKAKSSGERRLVGHEERNHVAGQNSNGP